MKNQFLKQSFGDAGNITVGPACAVDGKFCVIQCLSEVTFTALIDSKERTTAEYGVRATGTVTFTGFATADDVTEVNSIEYTYKATPTLATHVAIGTDATTQAAALVAAVNANDPLVTLSNVAGVATVTAVVRGTAGNAYTLVDTTDAGSKIAVSAGGTLSGGVSLTTAASRTYAAGSEIHGEFVHVNLATGYARLILSSGN